MNQIRCLGADLRVEKENDKIEKTARLQNNHEVSMDFTGFWCGLRLFEGVGKSRRACLRETF